VDSAKNQEQKGVEDVVDTADALKDPKTRWEI
jgi:hypothetical protein